jgi:tetrahydromethanopterin S-methyltransferase subunit F
MAEGARMMEILGFATGFLFAAIWMYVVLKVAQFIGGDDDDTDHLA